MSSKSIVYALRFTLCALLLSLAACTGKPTIDVHFNRFEQLLFDTPLPQLQSTLSANRQSYSTPLLNLMPDDPQFMHALSDFVTDPEVRRIYTVTDSLYHDLSWLEKELADALLLSRKLCPELQYTGFYTLLTADFDDYRNRVFCTDHELALSIDRYAVACLPGIVPSYIQNLSQPQYIAADCMAAIARANIALPDADLSLLDYAIAEGKALYYVQQTLPRAHDTIVLRYSSDQLGWIKANVEQVWGWLLKNNLLYSTDITHLRNLIDDAPHTNAFGPSSAPRTTSYIGLQIVSRYMKRSGATIHQLFENTDSRSILTTSAWRP